MYYNALLDWIDRAMSSSNSFLLLGDLNYNYDLSDTLDNNPINYIEQAFGLRQLVCEPTRVTHTTSTLLDVILTDNHESHIATGVIKLALSDHYMVYTVLSQVVSRNKDGQHQNIRYRDYKNFNKDKFLNDLECCLSSANHETDWNDFYDKFNSVSDVHAPIKTKRVKNSSNPWIDKEIVTNMYDRDSAKLRFNKSGLDSDKAEYSRLKKNVQRLINSKKVAYMNDVSNVPNNNPKRFWRRFKNALPKLNTKSIPRNMKPDVFNKYFTNIPVDIDSEFGPDSDVYWSGPKSEHVFKFSLVTADSVFNLLNALDKTSNLDVLNCDRKLLQLSAAIICVPLHIIFNQSLSRGIVNDQWKLSRVTPVFKGGDDASLENPSDYRPISICCHLAKLLEKVVKDQLMNYLTMHSFISSDQSAYLKGHSTITCLHRIIDSFLENINDNDLTGVCMLDITKCFDSINHKLLIAKLKCYGILDIENSWFQSYLSNRKQSVICNGVYSSFLVNGYGVPQGSVLGPLLFLLFVNDVVNTPLQKDSLLNLFADDLIVCTSGRTVEEIEIKMNRNVSLLSEWYKRNRLKIHPKKTKFMILGSRDQLKTISNGRPSVPVITHGKNTVYSCDSSKYLGLVLEPSLSWNTHIKELARKLNFQYIILKSLSSHCSLPLLRKYYNCYVQPRIDYGISIWGCTSDRNLSLIQRIQNRMVRILACNYDYSIPAQSLLHELKIFNVVQRRDYFLAKLMCMATQSLTPTYLSDPIVLRGHLNPHNVRNHIDVHLPTANNTMFKNSFQYKAGQIFNALPPNIKTCTSVDNFIKLYKELAF